MKTKLFLLGLASTLVAQSQVFFEDFEDSTVLYTTSVAEFSDGSSDFFTRIDSTDKNVSNASSGISNVQGTHYFGAMDIDGEGATLPVTMTFAGFDISGLTGLELSLFLAEDDASDGSQDWDASDSVLFEYQIDDGGYQSIFAVEAAGGTNTAPLLDLNLDGVGEGAEITSTLTEYEFALDGTGSVFDLRITFDLNAGDEDLFLDNITLNAVPEPRVYAAIAGLFTLVFVMARRRGARA